MKKLSNFDCPPLGVSPRRRLRWVAGLVALCAATVLLAFPSAAGAALILHYKLDEASGTTASDSVSTAPANGALEGGSSWTTAVPQQFIADNAYRNSGANGAAIDAGHVGKLDALGDLTITGWVNVHSAMTTSGLQDRVLSNRKAGVTDDYFDLTLYDVSGGGAGLRFEVKVNGAVAQGVLSEEIDFASGWFYFAVTRESTTGLVNIYLGTTDATTDLRLGGTGTVGTGTINGTNGSFMVGNTFINTGRSPEADYSDIRIYDTALSAAELDQIRLGNLEPIPEPGTFSLVVGGGLLCSWLLHRRRSPKPNFI